MAQSYARGVSSYDRALGFFDAVYGFALTLLVTTVNLSEVSTWQDPGSFLASNGTQFLSFAISFVVISAFWYKNNQLLATLKALDGATIWANIAVTAFVVFIPYTTDASGERQLEHLALPTVLYALNVAAATLASIAMYQIALRRGLADRTPSLRAQRAQLLHSLTTPAIFLLSIPVTYLSVSIWGSSIGGKLFWLLLLITRPVSGRWMQRIVMNETN